MIKILLLGLITLLVFEINCLHGVDVDQSVSYTSLQCLLNSGV